MQLLALKRVLVAIDLDGSSHAAWTSARDLAAAAGCELHVLHVARPEDDTASVEHELQRMGIAREDVKMHTEVGDPARAITLVADKIHADAIVLGPHRERPDGTRASGLGSTALAIVTNTQVPCLVTRRPLQLPLEQVVVGIDLSDATRGTLHVALSWASALRSRTAQPAVLAAVHVMQEQSSAQTDARTRTLDEALAPTRQEAGEWAGITLRTEIVTAESPVAGIATYVEAHSPGLLCLGTRGLGLDPIGRLGSVSADVMRRIDLPVLLVPPAMWGL